MPVPVSAANHVAAKQKETLLSLFNKNRLLYIRIILQAFKFILQTFDHIIFDQ